MVAMQAWVRASSSSAAAAAAASPCADVGQTHRGPLSSNLLLRAAGLTLPGLCSTFECSLEDVAAAAQSPLPSPDQQ